VIRGLTALCLILVSHLSAQSIPAAQAGQLPAGGAGILSLDDVLLLAARHNPRLRASGAAVEVARGAVLTAKSYANPTVTLGSLGRQRALADGAVPGMLHGFTVNQPLELPKVRQARISSATIGLESSRYNLAETEMTVRGSVKLAFYGLLRRKAEFEVARENLKLLEELRQRIEVQVRVGEAARLELTRADAEVAAAKIQVQTAELRRAAALATLDATVGTQLEGFEFSTALDPPVNLPPLGQLRAELLKRHPAIAMAEAETRRAEANLGLQRALRVPQPTFWADVLRQPDVSQYRYGVTLDLPLWNRREGPIAEAVGEQRHAAALAGQRRLEMVATLERAYSLYEVTSQQMRMFEAGTLRVAEAAVQAAEAAFRFGERSIVEVLDARRVLRAARIDYLNSQFDRQEALVELEQLGVVDTRGGRP